MNAVSPEYGQVHLPVHDGSQLGPVQLAQLQLLVTVVLLQTEKIFYNVEKYSVVRKTFYRMEKYIRMRENICQPVKCEFVQLLLGQVEVALDGSLDGNTVLKVG